MVPGGKPGGGWLKSNVEGIPGAAPGGGGNWGWGGAVVNPPLWATVWSRNKTKLVKIKYSKIGHKDEYKTDSAIIINHNH